MHPKSTEEALSRRPKKGTETRPSSRRDRTHFDPPSENETSVDRVGAVRDPWTPVLNPNKGTEGRQDGSDRPSVHGLTNNSPP